MLEAFEPDASAREILYQHDLGVVRLRRYLRAKAQQQLAGGAEARASANSPRAAAPAG
jgi:hypothetical protein